MKLSKPMSVALGLLIGAAVVFAGGQKDAKPAAKAGEPITLNLWHIHNQETRKTPIENAARRFETANPGVKVVVSIYENDPYKTKLKTVTGSDFPDVFHSWGGGWLGSFVDAGFVADITAESVAWKDKVSPAAYEFNRYGGKIYASPYIGSSTILYYNKVIFEKLGLKVPTTYSELMAVCDKLVANKIIPFAIGNKSQWPGAQYFVLLSMRMGGPDIFQKAMDKKVQFTDDVFIKAGEMLQDWVKKGYIPAGDNGINYDTGGSRMMFYTEQCAMMLQTSGFLSACKSENPEYFKTKLGVALFPAVEGGKGKITDVLSGENAFSVAASSKNKAMAAKLVGFLSTDEQFQKELVAGGTLGSLSGVPAEEPLLKAAMEQIKNATYLQNFIDQTLAPELANKHKSTTQGILGLSITPKQAAEEMQKAFDSAK
ncbi:MAG: extracellular solute-binding protein [Treponemataceae bacterium]